MAEIAISWISASDAAQQLAQNVGGQRQAQAAIHAAISAGTMEGRADLTLQEKDIGPLSIDEIGWEREIHPHNGQAERSFCKRPNVEAASLLVSSDFLSREAGWVLDESHTDWTNGTFVARKTVAMRQASKLPLKRAVILDVPHRKGHRTVEPQSGDKLGVHLRRAVTGMKFRRIDIQRLGETPSKLATNVEMGTTQSNEYYEADNLPPRTDEVDQQFRAEVREGTFSKHGVPGSPGFRARLIRVYQKRVRNLYEQLETPPRLPSKPTIARRVDRLLDEFRAHQKKMNRIDPI